MASWRKAVYIELMEWEWEWPYFGLMGEMTSASDSEVRSGMGFGRLSIRRRKGSGVAQYRSEVYGLYVITVGASCDVSQAANFHFKIPSHSRQGVVFVLVVSTTVEAIRIEAALR